MRRGPCKRLLGRDLAIGPLDHKNYIICSRDRIGGGQWPKGGQFWPKVANFLAPKAPKILKNLGDLSKNCPFLQKK